MSQESPKRTGMRVRNRIILTVILAVVIIAAGIAFYLYQLVNKDVIALGAPSDELTFMSNAEGTWDILIMNPDGDIVNITAENDEGDDDYFPSWAFQSDMVNFITDRSGVIGAGQVEPDGNDLRELSEVEAVMATIGTGRLDWDPQWSPDGTMIYFATLRDFRLEIYSMVNDGSSDVTRLTETSGLIRSWFMSVSPTGEQIAFISSREGNENIYVMDVDGENLMQLTTDPADDFKPAWSLDGEQILFISERETPLTDGTPDLYIMNADGSDMRPFGEDDIFSGNPMYNADATQVAYMSNEEGFWNIYAMDINGENVLRLTENDADYMYPVWRPIPLDEESDVAPDAEQTEQAEG